MLILSSLIMLLTGILPMLSGVRAPSPPSAPRQLTATLTATHGTRRVFLTWTVPLSSGGAHIRGYNIYRGSASGSKTFLFFFFGDQTSCDDMTVLPGATYYYRVTAYNSVGESTFSNEATITTKPAPTPPQNLRAVIVSGNISLTWEPPWSDGGSPIKGYLIYRRRASGNEDIYRRRGDDTTVDSTYNIPTALDNRITPGQSYFYRVSAVSDAGESGLSNEASATVFGSKNR